jgi:hypothetical protein
MKKLSVVLATMSALLVGLLLLGGQAMAAPSGPHLNWGTNVNPGQCPQGKLVINVTYKVVTIDSGEAENIWADDYANRHLQVWQTGDDTFCALVQDTGHFVTREGRSPGDSDDIAAGIEGTYQGGLRMTITGAALKTSPDYPTRGRMGTVYYTEPIGSVVHWADEYFVSGYSYALDWWGWIYRTPRNGTWVNSSDGNSGDITD